MVSEQAYTSPFRAYSRPHQSFSLRRPVIVLIPLGKQRINLLTSKPLCSCCLASGVCFSGGGVGACYGVAHCFLTGNFIFFSLFLKRHGSRWANTETVIVNNFVTDVRTFSLFKKNFFLQNTEFEGFEIFDISLVLQSVSVSWKLKTFI